MTQTMGSEIGGSDVSGVVGRDLTFACPGFSCSASPWVSISPGATSLGEYFALAPVPAQPYFALPSSPEWMVDIADRYSHLSSLPPGWDGLRAKAVSRQSLYRSLDFLLQVAMLVQIPPSLVPTVSGGVALEWHKDGIDVEVEFPSTGPAFASVDAHESEFEGELDAGMSVLVRTLMHL